MEELKTMNLTLISKSLNLRHSLLWEMGIPGSFLFPGQALEADTAGFLHPK